MREPFSRAFLTLGTTTRRLQTATHEPPSQAHISHTLDLYTIIGALTERAAELAAYLHGQGETEMQGMRDQMFGWNSMRSTSSSTYLLNAGLDPVWATRKPPD